MTTRYPESSQCQCRQKYVQYCLFVPAWIWFGTFAILSNWFITAGFAQDLACKWAGICLFLPDPAGQHNMYLPLTTRAGPADGDNELQLVTVNSDVGVQVGNSRAASSPDASQS